MRVTNVVAVVVATVLCGETDREKQWLNYFWSDGRGRTGEEHSGICNRVLMMSNE